MLRVKNVYKSFDRKKVLKGVSFDLEDKSITGLLGPNGAGKTTMMRIIVGFLKASKGKVEGVDKTAIGYLPENNPLYQNMTPIEYLRFMAEIKLIDKDKIDSEIKKIIKDCGLGKMTEQKIEILSKGYKQRVGLAAALVGDPKLLILDEPSSGLDPNQIIEIRNLIKQLAKSKTVLLSTHILPEAKEICKKLIIINNGQIVLDEETNKIKNLEKKFVELTI